jgi:hypothetical protein
MSSSLNPKLTPEKTPKNPPLENSATFSLPPDSVFPLIPLGATSPHQLSRVLNDVIKPLIQKHAIVITNNQKQLKHQIIHISYLLQTLYQVVSDESNYVKAFNTTLRGEGGGIIFDGEKLKKENKIGKKKSEQNEFSTETQNNNSSLEDWLISPKLQNKQRKQPFGIYEPLVYCLMPFYTREIKRNNDQNDDNDGNDESSANEINETNDPTNDPQNEQNENNENNDTPESAHDETQGLEISIGGIATNSELIDRGSDSDGGVFREINANDNNYQNDAKNGTKNNQNNDKNNQTNNESFHTSLNESYTPTVSIDPPEELQFNRNSSAQYSTMTNATVLPVFNTSNPSIPTNHSSSGFLAKKSSLYVDVNIQDNYYTNSQQEQKHNLQHNLQQNSISQNIPKTLPPPNEFTNNNITIPTLKTLNKSLHELTLAVEEAGINIIALRQILSMTDSDFVPTRHTR